MEQDIDKIINDLEMALLTDLYGHITTLVKKEDLEHLIKAYKELEEYYEEQNEVNAKFIPVSLVEEKIEDFRNKTVWGYNDWKYDENVYKAELNIIDKLEKELLEKRK